MRRTYSRLPPDTVRHCGLSLICSSPWLSQKRANAVNGNDSIVAAGHDQIAADIGFRYHSRNSRPKPWRSRNAPSVSPAVAAGRRLSASRASRLKRRMSASIVQNFGLKAFVRWANNADRLVPDHSMPSASLRTENDMSLAIVAISNVGRQEKFAARAKMLWDAVHYVEATAPPETRIAWMSGDSLKGGLNIEEGIHFQWHLYHRGRGDVAVGLFDETGRPLQRVELPPLKAEPQFALIGTVEPQGWEPERSFHTAYWMGRKRYDCLLTRKGSRGFVAEAAAHEQMKEQLLRNYQR